MKLKKFRGQHLLTDTNMVKKIVKYSQVSPEDSVIEIGAGTGLLTRQLALISKEVIAFEIDEDFQIPLEEIASEYPNVKIIIMNFLDFDLKKKLKEENKNWKVVANIPYNITSPIIEKLVVEGREYLLDIFLLIQKEVAQRIVAKPSSKEYGRLSVFCQFFFENKILFTVPPDVFVPPPQVDSALIRMTPKKEIPKVTPSIFFEVVKSAFSQRRKQIRNVLKKGFKGRLDTFLLDKALKESNIEKTRRGETLSLEEFAKLTQAIEKYISSH